MSVGPFVASVVFFGRGVYLVCQQARLGEVPGWWSRALLSERLAFFPYALGLAYAIGTGIGSLFGLEIPRIDVADDVENQVALLLVYAPLFDLLVTSPHEMSKAMDEIRKKREIPAV